MHVSAAFFDARLVSSLFPSFTKVANTATREQPHCDNDCKNPIRYGSRPDIACREDRLDGARLAHRTVVLIPQNVKDVGRGASASFLSPRLVVALRRPVTHGARCAGVQWCRYGVLDVAHSTGVQCKVKTRHIPVFQIVNMRGIDLGPKSQGALGCARNTRFPIQRRI